MSDIQTYEAGDSFEVCDMGSRFHGWNGKVVEVLDDGYYCMIDWFVKNGAIITFDVFEESQMATKLVFDHEVLGDGLI